MPNPRPKLENLKPFKPKGEATMAASISIRLPTEIADLIKALPTAQRSEWLRRVIGEAARRELMGQVSVDSDTVPQPAGDAQESPSTGDNAQIAHPQDEPPAKGARRGRKRGKVEGQTAMEFPENRA